MAGSDLKKCGHASCERMGTRHERKAWARVIELPGGKFVRTLAWKIQERWCGPCASSLPFHPQAGKLRCATCHRVWVPRRAAGAIPPCSSCKSSDTFFADDGGWEWAAHAAAADKARRQ